MTSRIGAIALALLSCGWSTRESRLQAIHQLIPVDQASQDVEFERLRERLRGALETGVARTVLDAMVPELSAFYERLWSDVPPRRLREARSDWVALETVLRLGGSFTTTRGKVDGRREFCAPYVYSAYPPLGDLRSDLMGEATPWAILGRDVIVRQRPSMNSRPIGRLSYELVKAVGNGFPSADGSPMTWTEVQLRNRPGYVADQYIRDPSDFHACFAKLDNRWKIVEFERGRYPS